MLKKIIITFLIVVVVMQIKHGIVDSYSCEDSCNDKSGDERLSCLNKVKNACETLLAETSSKKKTLKSTLAYIDSQMAYTQSQINKLAYEIEQLETEIVKLTGKILILNTSLEDTSKLFAERISEAYKQSRSNPMIFLFSSDGFSEFINRYTYLKSVQQNDRKVMYELEEARANYNQQKNVKQEKQLQVLDLRTEMINQQKNLLNQQSAKQKLLVETENDEKKYQQLLDVARAEFEAIQNVLAGGGNETEVGDVSEGQYIAAIIEGSSCNSNGSHLHFSVVEDGNSKNPFSYLQNVDHENCSGSYCGSSDGDPFNPGGSWSWPLSGPVKFNQGYGETWAIKNTWVGDIYSFHNGIDIYNSSLTIKAVKAGKLFRGSYMGSAGCTLRYVKVDHNDSNIDTYYLHVNYL